MKVLLNALPVGGTAIIATFSENGPEKCSGLSVQRYSSETLNAKLEMLASGSFELIQSNTYRHITPKKQAGFSK